MQKQVNQPQINETTIVLKVTEKMTEFPAHLSQIQDAIKSSRENDPLLSVIPEQSIRNKVIDANTKLIEWQFLDMMQNVLRKIQPQIKHYPENKSIKYLQSIIYEHLDPKIFSTVRISKIRNKLLGETLQSQELTIADKMFTQLISIMNQLLNIQKQYYGLQRDTKISGILFQVINMFIAENQQCFLVQQDIKQMKSKIQSQLKQSQKALSAMTKSQKDSKTQTTRTKSQTAKQTAQYLIGTLYNQIRHVNPFATHGKQMTQKQVQQKKNLLKQLNNVKKRDMLDAEVTKLVQKLQGMSLQQIIKTMSKEQKAQFTSILYDSLQSILKVSKSSTISKVKHIEQQIYTMLQSAVSLNHQAKEDQFINCREAKWIAVLYKTLQKQYHTDSQRRKWLMQFCQSQYISKKVKNPYAVLKILQNQKTQQSPILKALRSLPLTIKLQQEKKLNPAQKKQFDEKQIATHLALQHEMNRIHLYQLKKKYKKQPSLEFNRLTNSKTRVITLLFSGFLSEDTCKVQQWEGLLNNFYDSEVYAIRWQSKTVRNMMDFAVKSLVDLGPTQSIAMLGGPYVKAIAIMHNLYQKFKDNPFNPAFEAAQQTGQFMAEFIMHNFKGYFINLVGFSLGTELIKNIIQRMAANNSLNMLNKVYLLGGVADKKQVEKIISQSPHPLNIINLYSHNDYILKYLLRICKSEIQPVGLNALKQIQGHIIKNEDCTYFIQGHLAYRPNLQIFGKMLKMADD